MVILECSSSNNALVYTTCISWIIITFSQCLWRNKEKINGISVSVTDFSEFKFDLFLRRKYMVRRVHQTCVSSSFLFFYFMEHDKSRNLFSLLGYEFTIKLLSVSNAAYNSFYPIHIQSWNDLTTVNAWLVCRSSGW